MQRVAPRRRVRRDPGIQRTRLASVRDAASLGRRGVAILTPLHGFTTHLRGTTIGVARRNADTPTSRAPPIVPTDLRRDTILP